MLQNLIQAYTNNIGLTALCIGLSAIILLYLKHTPTDKRKRDFEKHLEYLIEFAERSIGRGQGIKKKKMVIELVHSSLPKKYRWAIQWFNEESLDKLIECVFNKLKEDPDNEVILEYGKPYKPSDR